MKRPPPTFVVEVRRLRRSTNSNGKAWLVEPARAESGRHAGAAALFESEPKAPAAAEAPPSRPQGRILPSLADIEPIASRFEEAAASPRRKRADPAAAGKPKTRTKKDKGRRIAPPVRSSEETPAVGAWADAERTAKALSAGAKTERKVAKAQPPATPALLAAKPAAIPEAALQNAAADRVDARQARHRRILDRYVLGAELKPGERWKRRLQKAR